MWIGFVVFGVIVFLGIVFINKNGEMFDRVNKKNMDAYISTHHKDAHNRRQD